MQLASKRVSAAAECNGAEGARGASKSVGDSKTQVASSRFRMARRKLAPHLDVMRSAFARQDTREKRKAGHFSKGELGLCIFCQELLQSRA
jgi:hypothetical protein